MWQNLPADMVKTFFKFDETSEVEIEDEFDNIFICKIWWGHRANQAHLTQGWGEFCAAHGLRGGSSIMLSVDPAKPSNLYSKVTTR